MLRIWPSLMNVGPSSASASRSRVSHGSRAMAAPPRAFKRSLAKSGPSRPIHAASSYLLKTVQISAQRPRWRRICGIELSFITHLFSGREDTPQLHYSTSSSAPPPVLRAGRYIVQRLKTLCPLMGKVKIAQTLARAGLPSDVDRPFKSQPPSEAVRAFLAAPCTPPTPSRVT